VVSLSQPSSLSFSDYRQKPGQSAGGEPRQKVSSAPTPASKTVVYANWLYQKETAQGIEIPARSKVPLTPAENMGGSEEQSTSSNCSFATASEGALNDLDPLPRLVTPGLGLSAKKESARLAENIGNAAAKAVANLPPVSSFHTTTNPVDTTTSTRELSLEAGGILVPTLGNRTPSQVRLLGFLPRQLQPFDNLLRKLSPI